MRRPAFINIITVISFILAPCFHAHARDRIPILVSVLPQQYFAERIGGDRVTVDVLVKPGKSPATYTPTPAQIRQLLNAKVYFRVGVPFENGLMGKITSMSPNTRIVDTRQGVPLRDMVEAHGHHHGEDHHDGHGETAEDDRQGKDPHIWMNPRLVKIQAQTMYQALCAIDAEAKDIYTENLNGFLKDLDALNDSLTRILGPLKGENLFVFHPSFGYLADAYGLHQVAIEAMGKAPKGKELAAIIRSIKENQGRIIFVQPQFDPHAARKIALAVNGSVVAIDPLAYDYLENMVSIGKSIANGLGKLP